VKNEEKLLIIEYDNSLRISFMIFRLLVLIFAVLLLIYGSKAYFNIIICIILIAYSIKGILDIGLFKRLTITNRRIIKEWYLYKKCIKVEDLVVNRASSIYGKSLFFGSNKNKLVVYFFTIYLLSIRDRKKKMMELKEVLKKLKIIKGDENVWDISY